MNKLKIDSENQAYLSVSFGEFQELSKSLGSVQDLAKSDLKPVQDHDQLNSPKF